MTGIVGVPTRGELPSAASIAAGVRSGRLSAVEVLDAHAERLAALNPRLGAVVADRVREARRDAAAIDAAVCAGHEVGPLAGVPLTVKDVLATADLPTTCGSRLLAGHRSSLDATVVARLRRAGAVLVGKTNCPEFALGVDTLNDLHGRTGNPLGDLTPGGSSGGESASLAAGLSALGVGTDYGGSVRWPAQCTGIAGLRPTIGRVPITGFLPAVTDDEPSPPNPRSTQGRLNTVGLLARSVADLALGLEVVAGPDGVDPFAVPVPTGSPAQAQLDGVELRHGADVAGRQVPAAVADAVSWAVEVLAGADVRPAGGLPPQLHTAVDVYAQLRQADPMVEIERLAGAGGREQLTALVRDLLANPPDLPEAQVVALWATRDRLAGELARWLRGDRLLVLPVAAELPYRRADVAAPLAAGQFDLLAASRAVSLFGLPALAAPCPLAPDGRPVSVQVVGPPFREDLVLAAGAALESACEARSRCP